MEARPTQPSDAHAADVETMPGRVAELTRARDEALTTAAGERDRVVAAMQQCEYLASEIWVWRRRHDEAAAQFADAAAQLADARVTIRNMEQSWFWRARLAWVRVRTLLARGRRA